MVKKTLSQNLWLKRKETDNFFKASKKIGYRARSAYKLLDINKKFNILRKAKHIVDLGAAPGGWSQVIIHKKLEYKTKEYKLFAVDLKNIEPIDGVIAIKKNISDLIESNNYFKKNSIHLILSDMAPASTGHKFTDLIKAANLSEEAFRFSFNYLVLNGNFICKLLGGNYDKRLIESVKKKFNKVCLYKPKASRKESKEIYLICLGFNNLQ